MDTELSPAQALALAVNRLGSQAAMGRLCGVTQQAVWKWLDEGMALPAEHVLKVECATRVSRHELRPDLYPRGLQDDVPFCPDPLEGPLAPSDDGRGHNRGADFQSERPAA